MVSIEHESIIDNLSNEANWRLCSIFIKIWHVVIIQEIDEGLGWGWSISSTGSLVYVGFEHDLEGGGISVGVEVHGGGDGGLLVKLTEVVLHDGGLTGTSRSDVDHTLLGSDMDVQEEGLSGGVGSWHNEVAEKTFILSVEFWSNSVPMFPASFDNIIEVVEDLSSFWEFEIWIGDQASVLVTEGVLVLIKGGSISPHGGEDEESLIDVLDSVNISVFLEFLQEIVLDLLGVELSVELVNNGSQRLDTLHIANWGDMSFATELINLGISKILRHIDLEDSVSMLIITLLVLGQP
jgi:hypothetical protein